MLRGIGGRLRDHRLSRGWTQEELAERAGVAVSTLKLLEAKGQGSLQRMARVASALGIAAEMNGWFAQSGAVESIEAAKQVHRQRAPRRKRKEARDGFDG
ncbi:MAG TPA: helix-turn-helix transcriptional regulator [Luteolibacter sp.]